MRKKVMITTYISPDQSDELKALSERTHVSMATYIREGLALVLKNNEVKS